MKGSLLHPCTLQILRTTVPINMARLLAGPISPNQHSHADGNYSPKNLEGTRLEKPNARLSLISLFEILKANPHVCVYFPNVTHVSHLCFSLPPLLSDTPAGQWHSVGSSDLQGQEVCGCCALSCKCHLFLSMIKQWLIQQLLEKPELNPKLCYYLALFILLHLSVLSVQINLFGIEKPFGNASVV